MPDPSPATPPSPSPPPATLDRTIRVFISSTFRDMMRERDLLVKEVFPALRRVCAARLVTFTEVDLRWGITEAQANEGQVLPLCLAEIERSRPYFIGLLGERYGWIPDTIRPEVLAREPWLRAHVEGRTSVTELEILHGVLNDPAMHRHAFFYFRDPAYATRPDLTPAEHQDLVEPNLPEDVRAHGEAEARRRTAIRQAKLAALKQRIRDSGLPIAEPYRTPEVLARLVRRQLRRLIDRLYPALDVPDALTRERTSHEAHARQKLFAWVDRPGPCAALTTFAEPTVHDGRGLVLTGESGSGKTVLLAAWARHWVKEHPNDFLVQHYFGATPESASPDGFLHRLLGELKARFEIADPMPVTPEKLREAVPLWLAQAANRGRIVLVLDGLNQVQGSEPERRLMFLPRHFPPNVTVLASALPGIALDELRERGWLEQTLPLATADEIGAMVDAYLTVQARTLEPDLRQAIVAAPGARNPLFLRTLLEELRQFGSFEGLPARVRFYLESAEPKDLFARVLSRWQEDFDGADGDPDSRRKLVRRTLSLLWAARQGLSESEWLDLLGADSEPLPRAYWTPLFLALEPHLSLRGGLLTLGHDYLRQAVEEQFVGTPELQRAVHVTVADYFEFHARQQAMSPRKAAEWPFQLHAASSWKRLEACLTSLPLFRALYEVATKWELIGYWHTLRARGVSMGDAYTAAHELWADISPNEDRAALASETAGFLADNGLFGPAEPLLHRALAASERVLGPEHPCTLTIVHNLASLLTHTGAYGEAEPLLRRALAGMEQAAGGEHPDTLHTENSLGALLYAMGAYGEAAPLLRRALAASERVLGPEHPATLQSVNNLALLLVRTGAYEEAEPLCRRALADSERVLGPEHPHRLTIVHNLASLLTHTGAYGEAEPLLRRTLAGMERVLGPEHPDTLRSVNNLGELLYATGARGEAEPLLRRALAGMERVLGPEHPQTIQVASNLARLLVLTGAYEEAEPLCRRALAGQEQALGVEHPDTLQSVNDLALLLTHTGAYGEAEPLLRRALAASERVLGPEHSQTIQVASNLARLLVRTEAYEEAEPLCRRALVGQEQALGVEHPDTLQSVNELTLLLARTGASAEAVPLARRALAGRERVLGPEHANTLESVASLAELLLRTGFSAEAVPLLRRALASSERVLGPEHPVTLQSVNNLALLLVRTGAFAEAVPLLRRALAASERVLGRDQPQTLTIVNNLAVQLERTGAYGEAVVLLRRALAGRERALGPEHPDTLTSVNNLALLLEGTGASGEAVVLLRRALAGRERVLGPEHQDTLQSMNNLAELLADTGASGEAVPLYRRALAAAERVPGPDQPQTLTIVNNLAVQLARTGASAEAVPLLRRALAGRERVLGPEHPQTLEGLSNLALLLARAGAPREAEPLLRRALAGMERVLGPEHPITRTVAANLDMCVETLRRTRS